MKFHLGHTQKPHDNWEANRQSGYDWDEEEKNEFSYEDVNGVEEYEEASVEPEYINVAPVDDGDIGFESLGEEADEFYARETEYEAEHQSFDVGTEYASETEYEAEQGSYMAGEEYAAEPDLNFEQEDFSQEPDLSFEQDDTALDSDLEFMDKEYVKPVQMNEDGSYETTGDDFSEVEAAGGEEPVNGDYDDGYLPTLSAEDTTYNLGDGYLPPVSNTDYEYGAGDGYLQPLSLEDDYSLGTGEEQTEEASEAAPGFEEEQEDAWESDALDQAELEAEEPQQENEFVQKSLLDYENPFVAETPDGGSESEGFQGNDFNDYEGEILYLGDDMEEEEQPLSQSYDRDEEEGFRSAVRTGAGQRRNTRRSSGVNFESIMALVGVLVIACLAGFIGLLLWKGKNKPVDPYIQYANIGTQLSNIELIGGKGIAAVANAEIARLTPELDPLEEDPEEDPANNTTTPEYNENDYKTTVKVTMSMTSVQKDLKIKFTNKETSKLIGNVKFVAEVTKPDGTVEEWTDTDMDGIIYEKGIDAGKYSVSLKELDEDKYSNYILPASAQTVTVKKNIEYVKVDVTGEAKKENEINVGKEDTKKNETENESALTDTVTWVSSTVTGNTYTEVLKSTVPDPLTLPIQMAKSFLRIAKPEPDDGEGGGGSGEGGEATPTPTPEVTPTPTPEVTPTPTPEVTPTPTPEITPEPTPEVTPTPTPEVTPTPTPEVTPTPTPEVTPTPTPEVTPTPTPEVTPTPTPEVTPTPTPTVVPTGLELSAQKVELLVTKSADGSSTVAETAAINAIVSGFTDGKELEFRAESNNGAVATASVDASGKVTIVSVSQGTAVITVTVDYKNAEDKVAGVDTAASKTVEVSVAEKETLAMSVDKAEILCYAEVTDAAIELTATIRNSKLKAAELIESNMNFVVESSDNSVIQIAKKEFIPSTADGTVQVKLTLASQALTEKKSAIVQVKYTEGEEEVTAKCAVTVKPHPKNDKTTPLLDKEGRQLYVAESDNNYRPAVYADYYVDGVKFFIQSGVKYTGWQTIDGKVYYYNADGNVVTGEQIIQGAKYQFGPDGVLMSGSGVLGIDVSKWNGSINWSAVKNSGVSYVIIRCGFRGSSGGMIAEDPKFTANIKGAINAGLKVGVYFFTQAIDETEAVYEASYVLDCIKNYKITYPVFLDVEASGGRGDKIDKDTRTKVCKAFCQTIQNEGYTAGIYANKTWLTEKINVSELSNFRIWLAQYASTPTYTGRYDIWQYKSTGSVNGISGDVDMNLSYMGY